MRGTSPAAPLNFQGAVPDLRHEVVMLLPLLAPLALAAPADQVMVNTSGEPLHWAEASLSFRLNAANLEEISPEDVAVALEGAAAAWSTAPDVHLDLALAGEAAEYGGLDEQNVVYFNDDWTSSPDLLALTSSWSDEEGVLVEFDLAVNTKHHHWSTDALEGTCDLQNTLTHELGHAIGIDHDDEHVEATMYPNATLGETQKRDLYDSDVEVAAWLYPERAEGDVDGSHPLFACSSVPIESLWLGLPTILFCLSRSTRRRKESPCS